MLYVGRQPSKKKQYWWTTKCNACKEKSGRNISHPTKWNAAWDNIYLVQVAAILYSQKAVDIA